jgi:hypothetical protein
MIAPASVARTKTVKGLVFGCARGKGWASGCGRSRAGFDPAPSRAD